MGPTKAIVAGMFCFGMLLSGCNSDGSGAIAVAEGDLLGKWVLSKSVTNGFYKITVSGKESTTPVNDTAAYTDGTYYVELKTGNAYTANYPGVGLGKGAVAVVDVESGTWSVSGNVVKTISSDNDTTTLSATVSGTAGTFVTVYEMKGGSGANLYETHLDITMTATKQ